MKRRESILYGRVEMLALEACALFHMKKTKEAFIALKAAYSEAVPNGILMPFIEAGRDMRQLCGAALRNPACDIPAGWLEAVQRKSATFSKHQTSMIFDYQKAHGRDRGITF